ncbi:hypothetical protein AWB80_06444 [Caballeronia pedi]|uniref:Uncharacterized protein n=1 Tax=Caballeronia pedi TaxID=1777141 RepID=A0A158D8L8_9BURK|nr:hypothetical protein AWB80_06444 [Caballeronia pedi]
MDYVVKMARDSYFRRTDPSDAQSTGDDADEQEWMHPAATRPAGSGISVRLWDEIAPAPPNTTPLLADDSPEG